LTHREKPVTNFALSKCNLCTATPWHGPDTAGGGASKGLKVKEAASYTFSDTNFVYVIAVGAVQAEGS
jgi:hypothetical protein